MTAPFHPFFRNLALLLVIPNACNTWERNRFYIERSFASNRSCSFSRTRSIWGAFWVLRPPLKNYPSSAIWWLQEKPGRPLRFGAKGSFWHFSMCVGYCSPVSMATGYPSGGCMNPSNLIFIQWWGNLYNMRAFRISGSHSLSLVTQKSSLM